MNKNGISFVTLYDKGYLSRGVALYQSLKKHCSCDFEMYVLSMDYNTYSYLSNRDGIKTITIEEVVKVYPVLERLRKERSYQEFCWTMASFFTQYVMRIYMPDICVYVDSDVFFWDDPCILLNEMKCHKKSVLITEHNYYYKYDQTYTSGKFCVQFMPFLNDINGNEVLEWWREKCEEKCNREADGITFGDQKYLDDWESRFEGVVHNCKNIGAGIAPWNCIKYTVDDDNGKKVVKDNISGISENIIFYHYHELQAMADNCWNLSSYDIPDDFKTLVYKPYIEILDEIEKSFTGPLCVSRPGYKLVEKYMFYPIPYRETRRAEIKYKKESENLYRIIATIEENKILTVDLMILNDGTLRILTVDDVDLFTENIHEIIWLILVKFMFKTDDVYDVNYNILRAIKEKRHIKLEWFTERYGDYHVEYPIFDKLELVKILSEDRYISRKNLYEL